MVRQNSLATAVGSAFLVVPVLFIVANVLEYEIGVALPWNPFDAIYGGRDHTAWTYFLDALIVFGPVLGFATLLAPITRVMWHVDRGGVAVTVNVRRGGWVTLGLIDLSVTATAILGAYLVAENLPCILGQQVKC